MKNYITVMPSIILNKQVLNYKIRRSSRTKNIKISIKSNGKVFVSLPSYFPDFAAKKYLKKQTSWIFEKLSETSYKNNKTVFLKGQILNYLGVPFYKLCLLSGKGKRSFLQEHFSELHFFKGINDLDLQEEIQIHLQNFYKKKARDFLKKRVLFFTEKLNLKHNKIFIKSQKTRWGSCSSKNNLNFNWRIILAPREIIDYLVIHEVCHLKEMNHGPKFWNLVKTLDPHFKIHRKFLNKEGKSLNF